MWDFPLWLAFPALALTVYRICRFFIEDRLFDGPRRAIWTRFPPETTKTGYLFTCYWCMSIWVGAPVVALYLLWPAIALPIALLGTVSALAGFIDKVMDQ